jgi:PAS domain S-box-containing protein
MKNKPGFGDRRVLLCTAAGQTTGIPLFGATSKMEDENKTQEQLINELVEMRQRIAELEASETERKRAEEEIRRLNEELEQHVAKRTAELRESEERFRQMAETTHDIFWVTDPKTAEMLYVSPAYKEIFGRTCASVYEHPGSWLDAVHPEDRERVNAALEKQVQGQPTDEEYRIMRPDGSVRWIWDRSFPIRNGAGEVYRITGIAEDITEHKRAEEALRHKVEQLAALSKASQAVNASLDLNQVLDTILVSLEQMIPYDGTSVFLYQGDLLNMVAGRGALEQAIGLEWPADEALFQEVRRTSRPLVLADAQADHCWKRWSGFDYLDSIHGWMAVPLMVGGKIIGCLTLASQRAGAYGQEDAELVQAFANQAATAIQHARLFEQVRTGRERLQTLACQLVEVQETERSHIVRALHDELGQDLASLMVGLRLVEREAERPEAIVTRVAELKNIIKSTSENLHRLAMDLRPASLDRLGLVAALRQHLETFSRQHGLTVHFEAVDLDGERLPPELETALYRIVQEALTNVIRHARHATRAAVLLKRHNDRVTVAVEDNGAGFDPEMAMQGDRLGLLGMRERAEMLNGTLVVESTVGGGTTVFAEVPYVHSHPDS